MRRPVVITGRGVISSLGDSPEELHRGLAEGRSGISSIGLFDADGLSCDRAGEVTGFTPRTYLDRRNFRPLDRTSGLTTAATSLALVDAGLDEDSRTGLEIGLVLGTMYCSVKTIAEFDRRAMTAGPMYASVMDFANSVINAAAGQAAIWHGLTGVNSTLAMGQVSGLRAIAQAADLISSGRADIVLAGGSEELCLESFLAFERTGWMCRTGEDDAPRPVPFAADRNGFLLGEGAAVLVLESAESAETRGATILGRILGSGVSFDPTRGASEASAMEATARALDLALAASKANLDDVGAISASANGGRFDEIEARALAGALGQRAELIPVMAVKASLGETLGAAGALQAVAALEALRAGEAPGVRGLERLPADFPLPRAGIDTRPIERPTVMLDAVGLDGHRCALLMTRESG